jgi:hypothetical protein
MNVEDYVFAFANIHYKNNIVISGDFEAAIPIKLGKAIATDKPSNDLSAQIWSDTAPVEGVGGIMGFRPLNKHHGTTNEQFSDPKWQAPKGADLTFKFYCTQPQSLILKVNDHYVYPLEITASNHWQEMTLKAEKFISTRNQQALAEWSNTKKMQISPKPGADITKVIFAKFEWIKAVSSTSKTSASIPASSYKMQAYNKPTGSSLEYKSSSKTPESTPAGEKIYLTKEMASSAKSFLTVTNNKAVGGTEMSIGGQKFSKGLGVHADSELIFLLDGSYSTFEVMPGADDAHRGNFIMKILLDDKEVYNSGLISSANATQAKKISLALASAKQLKLIVEAGDGTIGGDHANWANACFTKENIEYETDF